MSLVTVLEINQKDKPLRHSSAIPVSLLDADTDWDCAILILSLQLSACAK